MIKKKSLKMEMQKFEKVTPLFCKPKLFKIYIRLKDRC